MAVSSKQGWSWRSARTHTLHDPAAWKVQHLGRFVADGTPRPTTDSSERTT